MTKRAFRPRISICVKSGFCSGPQWQHAMPGIHGAIAHAGDGCVSVTSLKQTWDDYMEYLTRCHKTIIMRDGTVKQL